MKPSQIQKERRQELIIQLGGRCTDCSTISSLEFDHIDPTTKLFKLSGANLQRKWDTVQTEAAKCQLLCKPCHIRKTWDRDRQRVKHGTESGYTGGCRCSECRHAHAIFQRAYRHRKKAQVV